MEALQNRLIAAYSEERIASPAILMADIAGPRLSAASVIDSPAAICESQRAYVWASDRAEGRFASQHGCRGPNLPPRTVLTAVSQVNNSAHHSTGSAGASNCQSNMLWG